MENSKIVPTLSNVHFWVMFGLAVLLIFWGNHFTLLWNQDEAAYAGFASHMIKEMNWLVPDFTWSDAHRKTPLHFWLIASSYVLFGINEFAVRFSSSLAILGTLSMLYFWGGPIWGKQRMLITCYVLLSSVLFVAIGKVAVTDATLLFFETACALALARIVQSYHKKWVYVFWIGISLGVLTKGPPIVIFLGLMGLLILIFHPDGRKVWKLKPWLFAPLSLIPLFLWGYLAWQSDNGKFITWLIDWYILRRVSGNVFGQTGPPGYYLAIFLGTFLFWMPLVIPAIIKAFRRKVDKQELLWAAWLVGGWFLYEILSSKLPAYTIAAHPAVAISIATLILRLNERKLKKPIQVAYLFLSILFLGAMIFWLFYSPKLEIPISPNFIFIALVIIFLIMLMLYWQVKTNALIRNLWVILPLTLLFNFYAWTSLIPVTQPFLDSAQKIIQYLEDQEVPRSASIVLGHHGGKPPSLPFYIENEFPQMVMEADTIKVFEAWYNTPPPAAFILSKHQVSVIERLSQPIEAKEIMTNQIDRQNMISYFVVLKK